MQAERVKEIVLDVLKDCKKTAKDAGREYADNYLRAAIKIIGERWAKAEAAEQEEWKDLPMCSEERGKEVARAIDPCPWYNPYLCAYHRCQEGDIIFHRCALPIDEPAADAEPEREDLPISYKAFLVATDVRLDKLEALFSAFPKEVDSRIDGLHERLRAAEELIGDLQIRLCNHLTMHVEVVK